MLTLWCTQASTPLLVLQILILVRNLQMDYQGSNVRDFLHANGHVMLERVDINCNQRAFTQKEIDDITSGYSTALGEGGFGNFYK